MRVKINNREYLYFNDFSISLKLDSIASTFSFTAKFDPDNIVNRYLFKPLSYPDIEIFSDSGKKLISGYIVSHNFVSSSEPNLVQVSGYSKAGFLDDCTIPLSEHPLESLNLSIKDLAERFFKPFGISISISKSVEAEMNTIIDKSVAEPDETVKSFISKLVAQRNILITNTYGGNVLFTRINTTAKPKRFFNEENTNSMSIDINGQGMHSVLSIMRQPSAINKDTSTSDTVSNGLVKRYRPSVKKMTSGEDTDTTKAIKNVLGSQLKNINLTVSLNQIDYDLERGDVVEVHNHEIYLFKRTRFIVSEINISETNNSEQMTLLLQLPQTYTGEQPLNIFDYDNFGKTGELHH